jgi:hypothetical protein
METRTILVANTKTQQRYSVESSATTLGELKAQLRAQGIDYSGMSFMEGISKTQLLADDTPLPTNVMYKGAPTNNLVMLLTNTQKNIASGADGSRKDAYAIIKASAALQDTIKEAYGRNYTQVPTTELWHVINQSVEEESEEPENTTPTASAPVAVNKEVVNFIYDGIKMFLKSHMLCAEDFEALMELISELHARLLEEKPVFSDADIDEIIANL